MGEVVVKDEAHSILERIKELFSFGESYSFEKESGYERQLLDSRIENYLDAHFDEYIQEYGLVTEVDMHAYEERFERLRAKVGALNEFRVSIDAKVTGLERKMERIERAAKKVAK